MSTQSFKSVFMVASCAGAALGCYLVSLRVASERSALENVENKIVVAQRDIRLLQTEIGTRGRLAQLERWNAGAFSLSAPSAGQFLNGGFELAKLTQPEHHVDVEAPVLLASAPAPEPKGARIGEPDSDDAGQPSPATPGALLYQASLKTGTREARSPSVTAPPQVIKGKPTHQPVAAAISASQKSVDKPGLAAAKPMTKAVHIAKIDPLAPLPGKPVRKSKDTVSGQ
jgi:hypothetical protein